MRSSLTGFFPAAAFFPPAGAAEAVFLTAFLAVLPAAFCAAFLAGGSADWSADSFTAMTATPSHP
ncbi:hypothetical protein [Streptomyces sp. NPDC020983]|uniref:hypothetical protein n=1 Tax=Streptomyces sp. NPDC020983 TaxID=3365106 RepID=UPI00378D1224